MMDISVSCFLQQYDKARMLLLSADGVVHQISYPISRLIRNEILFVDLMQYYGPGGAPTAELAKRVKACVNALQIEKGTRESHRLRARTSAHIPCVHTHTHIHTHTPATFSRHTCAMMQSCGKASLKFWVPFFFTLWSDQIAPFPIWSNANLSTPSHSEHEKELHPGHRLILLEMGQKFRTSVRLHAIRQQHITLTSNSAYRFLLLLSSLLSKQ